MSQKWRQQIETEDVWSNIFANLNQRHEEPPLVLFSGTTRSTCGLGQAAMGPFYCSADKNAYIDLSFYRDLQNRFNAPGDVAQALSRATLIAVIPLALIRFRRP